MATDYVLGTADEEITRLRLQNAVWRPRALDGWRRAGFTTGQTLLDVGCGPGFATLDLAQIVGPMGRIIAVDQSPKFLKEVDAARSQAQSSVDIIEADLDSRSLRLPRADGAWMRWVLCFLKNPRAVIEQLAAAIRPGGVFVSHEYFDYGTWRLSPRSEVFESFVTTVMQGWRSTGGEPDIALQLPQWLEAAGFEVRHITPIVDIVTPANFVWQWPASFVREGGGRLRELGYLSDSQVADVIEALDQAERTPGVRMITPSVAEIIAVRR